MTLSAQGWSPTTKTEIRDALVSLWRLAFGANTDTDPSTPDGLEIDIICAELMLAFDVDTGLWADSFFRSASGIALERILDLLGKYREPATSSTGTVVFYGSPSTPAPAGTTLITADTAANRFTSDALATTGLASNSDAWMSRLLDPISVGDSYIIQIDANPALAAVAGGGDDLVDVATDMRDQVNAQGFATAALAGTDASGNALLVVEVLGGPGNVAMTFTGSALVDSLEGVRADVTATTTGPVVATAGSLQDISNPVAGITGVSNDTDISPGVEAESDDELRARHLQTLFDNQQRTDGGMRGAVSRVVGVDENSVVSNRQDDPVDVDGRPIGSVENIILMLDGASADPEIANAIARQIPAGVEPYGLRSFGTGTTVDGELIEVFATDVEKLYLHLSITVTKGEGFPTSGDIDETIKAAIATYFDTGIVETEAGTFSDPTAKLTVDKDMLREACKTPINIVTNTSAPTIGILTDTTPAPGDVPVFAASDRPATKRQIIRADASRIAVTVV